ncbi:MAG: hypothetical protein HGA61_03610 [Candidatus Moranbacteria bacterium]|nr:hypothetical protein [Candidatus Moranbacteria bacterium]
MEIKNIAAKKWQKNWAGQWSLLTCGYMGYQFTQQLKDVLGVSLEESLFAVKKGTSSCYILEEHKEYFGKIFAGKAEKDPSLVFSWAKDLKEATDNVLEKIKELKKKPINKENFGYFVKAMYQYGVAHRIVKVTVDYLSQEVIQNNLDILTDARVYAEPVYEETEKYMRFIAEKIAAKEGFIAEHILAFTLDQWDKYLEKGTLPSKNEAAAQYEKMFLYVNNGVLQYIDLPKEQKKIEDALLDFLETKQEIQGQIAYKGKVMGKVRIVLDPARVTDFKDGDVLVTGMTRPEYFAMVQKSVAFITDAGGVLSHAAITARELQKPCIIGTNVATKVLKDGDLVEVDADNGIIKILK